MTRVIESTFYKIIKYSICIRIIILLILKRNADDFILSYSAQAMCLIYFSTSVFPLCTQNAFQPSEPQSPYQLSTNTTALKRQLSCHVYMYGYIYK